MDGYLFVMCSDTVNSNKLMAEYEKYQELQARSQKLQEVGSCHDGIIIYSHKILP